MQDSIRCLRRSALPLLVPMLHELSTADYMVMDPGETLLYSADAAFYLGRTLFVLRQHEEGVRCDDDEIVEGIKLLAETEGIIPALECSHALAWLMAEGSGDGSGYDLLTLSGRGDKDLAEVLGLDE